MANQTIEVRVTPEQKEYFKAQAQAQCKTFAAVLRKALIEEFGEPQHNSNS